jgi:hypothetical protein
MEPDGSLPCSQDTPLVPSCARWIHTSSCSCDPFLYFPPFTLTSCKWSFSFTFPDLKFVCTSHLSLIRATCPCNLILLDFFNPDSICRTVQMMKLPITYLYSSSRHYLSLMPRYSPCYQHPSIYSRPAKSHSHTKKQQVQNTFTYRSLC